MTFTRTQIYLEPAQHRALTEEAEQRGMSLAALLRDVVAGYLERSRVPSEPKGFDALYGVVCGGPDSDVVGDGDEYRRDAMERRYRKKLGAAEDR